MEYSEMINDFVDGKLNPADEDKLFSMLSADQDMRYELRNSIRMEKAFSNDAGSIAPSAAATVGVFGSLGIVPPGVSAAPMPTGWARFTGSLAKFSNVIIGSAISSIVTAVIILALLNPWGNKGNGSDIHSGQSAKYSAAIIADSTNNYAIPVSKSSAEEDMIVKEAEPVKERIVYKYIERPAPVPEKTDKIIIADNDIAIDDEIREYNAKEVSYTLPLFDKNNDLSSDHSMNSVALETKHYDHLVTNVVLPKNIGLTAEIRGNHYWSFPKAQLGYSTTPLFNNTSFGLMYNVNDKFSAGFDIRQEYFYQEYKGIEDDIRYRYVQHPNYLSYGLTAKLRFMEFDYFNSFVQAYLGGNQAGPVGRLMYGFEIAPGTGYRFILGLEGSMMVFHHGDQYFYTPKIGLHYGMSFDF
jgi:hypothetical protein